MPSKKPANMAHLSNFSNEGRMVPVNISIPLSMLETIDRLAKESGKTRSEYVRDGLQRFWDMESL